MRNDWERKFTEHLRPLLPLSIRRAAWQDPNLTLGDDAPWSFATTSAWRVADSAGVLFGWSSAEAGDRVWDLCGLEVREVLVDRLLDPSLILSNGWRLDVFSDQGLDPWLIRLPGITLVGDALA